MRLRSLDTRSRRALQVGVLGLAGALIVLGAHRSVPSGDPAGGQAAPRDQTSSTPSAGATPSAPATGPLVLGPAPVVRRDWSLPGGRDHIFGDRSFLVAYYGTAGTGALGVLGETGIDTATRRLRRAAAPFRRGGERLQPVYELIVTVADAHPGKDGSYSHEIPRRLVRPYIRAAHRHGALLLLDLQPGRTDFLTVAKRWEWALRDPWVSLALDPEWRVGRRQVPARVIGSVSAPEVNRVSAWLARLVREDALPEKMFVLHQFRTSMIRTIGDITPRPGLALVQHVDGFGNPGQKLGTYHAVVHPKLFTPGFKLFYDEDRPRMRAAAVRAIRPRVRFVSFQ